MMPNYILNYENSIIYKLCCQDLNVSYVYVGHTTNFIKRKSSHKTDCNNNNGSKYNLKVYQTIRDYGGWENWSMIKIEDYACSDKLEVSKRERYWYETLNADLNARMPCISKEEQKENLKEYRELNKDKTKEYNKHYHQANQDKIKEQKKFILKQTKIKSKNGIENTVN